MVLCVRVRAQTILLHYFFFESYHDIISFPLCVCVCVCNACTLVWRVDTRIGLLVRSALSAAIYDKSLKISGSSIESDHIVNLMSNDCQRFEEMCKYSTLTCAGLTMFSVGIALLCVLMNSWFPVLGVVFIMILLPVQVTLANKFGKLRDQVN